jgi:hypothetical protein
MQKRHPAWAELAIDTKFVTEMRRLHRMMGA